MKILFTIPAHNPPHGGYRIIYEWCNVLSGQHEVSIYSLKKDIPTWYNLNKRIKLMSKYSAAGFDCLVITSPHSIDYADRYDCPKRVILFCQMAEHLFQPDNSEWRERCNKFYNAPYPMFYGAEWIGELICNEFGRTGEMIYIPDGINLNDFPIDRPVKDGKTILVEGWECLNPAKDTDHIAPKVAERLKQQGYKIIAYSQSQLKTMRHVPNEYHVQPNLRKLNELYSRATLLLKASHYDSRALSPVEAMTKGTVTARAIDKGDDDIQHGRTAYDENELYNMAISLLTDEAKRKEIVEHNYNLLHSRFNWQKIGEQINEVINRPIKKTKAKTVIISVIYEEENWKETKQQLIDTELPIVFVSRNGVVSLAKAINDGYREACNYYEFEYMWVVTNITFDPIVPKWLEKQMDETDYAMIHPSFDSDHLFCRRRHGKGLQSVVFTEFTAPIVRKTCFDRYQLDEDMPYIGHDIDWCKQMQLIGQSVAVDYDVSVGHIYNRHLPESRVTQHRRRLRILANDPTIKKLKAKYGIENKSMNISEIYRMLFDEKLQPA